MKTISGMSASAQLSLDALTLRTRSNTRYLPLTAIQSVTFEPVNGFAPGWLRAELVADWSPPLAIAKDVNTIMFQGAANNPEWAAFADQVRAAVDAAQPKKSLSMYADREGSGWPGADQVERTAVPVVAAAPVQPQAYDFGGVTLYGDTLSYHGQVQMVRGARAAVESAGQFVQRSTATRVTAGAIFFGHIGAIIGAIAHKNVDKRELYLHVDGDLYSWSVALHPKNGRAARYFAAQVNTAAKG